MTELDRAISQIAEMRAQLAASTRFRGFAPQAVAATAALAVGAAAVQALMPGTFNASPRLYVAFWAGVAVIAGAVVASEAIGRSRRAHGAMADGMLGSALGLLLPAGAAGAVITFILFRTAPETLWLLPGLWQFLIALAGFTALPMLSPEMRWASLWYMASGTVCLVLAKDQATFSPWLMGVPFGVGQAAVAYVLHRSNEASRG